jgi:hypothetical protein
MRCSVLALLSTWLHCAITLHPLISNGIHCCCVSSSSLPVDSACTHIALCRFCAAPPRRGVGAGAFVCACADAACFAHLHYLFSQPLSLLLFCQLLSSPPSPALFDDVKEIHCIRNLFVVVVDLTSSTRQNKHKNSHADSCTTSVNAIRNQRLQHTHACARRHEHGNGQQS